MYLTEQIHQQLFHEILEGKYQPGERMPTEMETAARFQASRVTVRRAYAILEKAGIIVRRKRCGTIVSSNYSGSTEKISAIAAIISWFVGMLLQTIKEKDRQQFEFHLLNNVL